MRVMLWFLGTTFPVAFVCSITFLHEVLEEFQLQIHHLMPNGFLILSKFCWACESYGAEPTMDTFCAYYELQRQSKKVKVDGVELYAQYGSCAFMAKRQQGVLAWRFLIARRINGIGTG
jgi:hypothetical protein